MLYPPMCRYLSLSYSSVALQQRQATPFIMKMKIHSSCEIEDFAKIHLCKLCVILRSRVLRVVCPH